MRQIKFRAWDKIAKMFCQVKWATDIDNSGVLYPVETKPKTDIVLTQFTGLLDKNGKEIYEGDIVEKKLGEYCKEVVEYGGIQTDYESGGYCYGVHLEWSVKDYEVIGNIYENPELIK